MLGTRKALSPEPLSTTASASPRPAKKPFETGETDTVGMAALPTPMTTQIMIHSSGLGVSCDIMAIAPHSRQAEISATIREPKRSTA